eukprot:9503715-Karenia_brevis.AAC.1
MVGPWSAEGTSNGPSAGVGSAMVLENKSHRSSGKHMQRDVAAAAGSARETCIGPSAGLGFADTVNRESTAWAAHFCNEMW